MLAALNNIWHPRLDHRHHHGTIQIDSPTFRIDNPMKYGRELW